ncbi:D-isomer specific 2-hydroxyacid dehydrogenase [Halteromyces radiatus]|uniref:D-isomer specific 2-hydroxyacid dehydrogenase n=1 Tax=Halteromyces radiatus TaxID=101107 RepID=UPI00221FCCDB|nr:D-isomer specific 2-hydroxyacid dehydrogenase [Halteromyces radiatus]KAI8100164.1 D-isomer specific 2-hydroxyacid dehydrogenase [Halteromyces radiatus]
MKVLVTRELPKHTQNRLEKQDLELIQWKKDCTIPRDTLLNWVKGVDAIICLLTDKIDKELLDHAGPQLKVVATVSIGYDHCDITELRARNIQIGYTPDCLTDATADLTLLLVLAASRCFKEGIRAAENGEWREWRPNWLLGSQFSGKTLGVIGLGRIGQAVAKRLKAFGITRILYHGRSQKPQAESELGAEFSSFDNLLKESDYITVCCALTPETQNLFDYVAFSKMKSTAVFVNTARGGIVKQDDLVRALDEKLIAAVGLDVTTPEPLPTDHKLYQFNNCIILPHVASATEETREKMASMALDNVLAAVQGQRIPYGV